MPLDEFFSGVRKTLLRPDEIVADIFFPALTEAQRGTFIKVGLRKAQAIVDNFKAIVEFLDNYGGPGPQKRRKH